MKKRIIQVGTLGSGLGALAGIIEMSIGATILPWIGNKESPAVLGAITFFLSVIAFLSVLAASRNETLTRNRQLLIFLGVLLPATICFTTVGRLWYLPGLLLIITACLLGYEYWLGQPKTYSSKNTSRKLGANQIIGVIGSLAILVSVALAFFNSSFGLYQSEILMDSKLYHFEILPMDIARLTDLSGGRMLTEDIEVRLVMIVYILLILGAAISLISNLVNSKMVAGIGGILVLTALAMFPIYFPAVLEQLGVTSMSFQSTIESLTIGWYLSAVGMSLIMLSSFPKVAGLNNPNPKKIQALPPDTMV